VNALLSSVLAADSSGGNPLSILILILPIAAIFWLFIGPQRKQRQRQQSLMSSIDVGDEVVTNGGIIGTITHIEDDVVHLEIDHDVVIRVAKSAISQSTSAPEPTSKASGSGSAKSAKPAPSRRGGLLGSLTGAASSDDDSEDEPTENTTPNKNGVKKK
jgi:preprotein translocase subunit YajC